MKTVSQYPTGMFSWVDMNSTNTEAAAAFYTAVFGWSGEANPMPQGGTYTMFQIEGHAVAGMGDMPPGTP